MVKNSKSVWLAVLLCLGAGYIVGCNRLNDGETARYCSEEGLKNELLLTRNPERTLSKNEIDDLIKKASVVEHLPKIGDSWTAADRKKLSDAFMAADTVLFHYPDNTVAKSLNKKICSKMNFIATLYRRVNKNQVEAFRWYYRSAQAGNVDAMVEIAMAYEMVWGVKCDFAKSLAWYRKAADAGSTVAMGDLCLIYLGWTNAKENHSESFKWLLKTADAGNVSAMNALGMIYTFGTMPITATSFPAKRTAESTRLWVDIWTNWDFYCVKDFLFGFQHRVKKDYLKALKFYRKAAESGCDSAMYNIGMMYTRGFGVEKSDSKAIEWFRNAAESGNTKAMRRVGKMYTIGLGVGKDYFKAYEWFSLAAKAGSREGMYILGTMYARGLGTDRDEVKALKCYLNAAGGGKGLHKAIKIVKKMKQ